MARRLVAIATSIPRINSTLVDDARYLYEGVNLGFTVQSGAGLYLVTVADAQNYDERAFVDRLNFLQRKAMKNRLEPSETTGATVSFTSMARWNVPRHQPILPPYTAMIVAHSAPRNGSAVLGATYDHRVLTGADVVAVLNQLKEPPREDSR
jgi:pyruvate/2-oxoglutarate dehydrogenase complex dihydrolipoamide acyltransferase (E2) component